MSHTNRKHHCNRHRLSIFWQILDFLTEKDFWNFDFWWSSNWCLNRIDPKFVARSYPASPLVLKNLKYIFEPSKFTNHLNCERQKVVDNLCKNGTSSSSHFSSSFALFSLFKLFWPSEQKCYRFLTRSLSQSLSGKVIVETSIPFILEFLRSGPLPDRFLSRRIHRIFKIVMSNLAFPG